MARGASQAGGTKKKVVGIVGFIVSQHCLFYTWFRSS